MTSKIFGYVYVLIYFVLVIYARSIYETEEENIYDQRTEILLANYRHRFDHSMNLKKLRWGLQNHSKKNKAYCSFCDLVVPVVRLLISANETEHIENIVNNFCKEFHIIDIDVCTGAVHEYKDAVIAAINSTSYSSKQLCALALNCDKEFDYPILAWNVTIPADKPKPIPQPPQPPKPDAPIFTVLHLSDIHVDFSYTPGSNADCTQPLCCRGGQPAPGHIGAGFWGDTRDCDIPIWTAEVILKYASEVEKIDFIYYTGDLPAHNVWNQSREQQLYSVNTINQLLAQTFPNKTFYPAIGNHEAAPCNLFPPPNVRTDNITWLYEVIADNWIKLGLPEDTRENITRGGFYTTVIRPGLRLISLNMNYCSWENFWLFINSTDPLGQLQWMVNWLQYAEDHGEKVHIIGHIPPKECLASFSWNFNKIVNRYENTIAGQFYGHTHNDEIVINYDEIDRQRPVSMGYITPSLTTFSDLHPGYRVYKMDGYYANSSYWVLDHRTVIMNMTATNLFNQTIFLDEYVARDAYQMENLFPQDWHNLIEKLKVDLDGPLMGLVYKYYTKSFADPSQCDHNCRRGLLCSFISARSDDPRACDSIPK